MKKERVWQRERVDTAGDGCVVGSGPAGFHTAEKMLRRHQGAEVDIVDRLLMPYGLVRTSVAPDHPETKIVTNQFSRVAQNERCSFSGKEDYFGEDCTFPVSDEFAQEAQGIPSSTSGNILFINKG
ncbi:hypothetical protein LOK49_LG07G01356 [Camellia lanceoleosa]|uniref:Uncharacterized protein n=1 Tax=Camellia lanceoleosa TaxID=1840588 RepID=A0ACC0H032_9ERIC|nr:hypothetical protein LOK49_LG07G01356 [Camellia lanceoleosa]